METLNKDAHGVRHGVRVCKKRSKGIDGKIAKRFTA